MPKIVIREYDKTKAVGPEYASFAVVVPGFIGSAADTATDTTVFDKNGIYECSSRDDFVKNVNTTPNATVLIDKATGPVINTEFGEAPRALTRAEFNELVTKGNLYEAKPRDEEVTDDPIGKLRDRTYIYALATSEKTYVFKLTDAEKVAADKEALTLVSEATENLTLPTTGVKGTTITWASNNEDVIAADGTIVRPAEGNEDVTVTLTATITSGDVTDTKDFTVIVKAETAAEPAVLRLTRTVDEPVESEPDYTLFVVLEDLGKDAEYETHYGNQIAYELLGLGYTVLYKRIETIADLTDSNWWKPLKDKSEYDFRYIISGLLGTSADISSEMVAVAKFDPENQAFDKVDPLAVGRGDCIALLDIEPSVYQDKNTQEDIIKSVCGNFGNIPTSKYAAAFIPTVTYTKASMDSTYENRTFPASFHYLACAARSSERFSEWYANAGYTRGISNYIIEATGCNLGEAAVNAFQRRFVAEETKLAINPIIKLRGSYYLWGNRTTEALGDRETDTNADLRASHFLNIRQLCCTLKKQVYVACRQFTFDPNSATLWTNFCNTIRPTLEKMKADQGISDYKILKVKSDRKAFLSAIIRIVPIEAVEDFDISVYLEDSIAGTIANTEESE